VPAGSGLTAPESPPGTEVLASVDPGLKGGIASPDRARKLLARAWLQEGRPDRALAPLRDVLASGTDPEAPWLSSRPFLQRNDAPHAAEALARTGDYGRDDPVRPDPAPYVGAAACARCHAEKYRGEQRSRHARTFATAEEASPFPITEHAVCCVPWADAGPYLRLSVAYLAVEHASEDSPMPHTVALLAWLRPTDIPGYVMFELTVGDGASALRLLVEHRPSLILLDLMLPVMDGFAFLQRVRSQPEWQGIPIVVMTAKELTEQDRRRLNGAVQDILEKGRRNVNDLLEDVLRDVRRYVLPSP